MDWKSVKLPAGAKLCKTHAFTFMLGGSNYLINIDEYADGAFVGHSERTNDKSSVVEAVTAKSMNDCLSHVVEKIKSRTGA